MSDTPGALIDARIRELDDWRTQSVNCTASTVSCSWTWK